MAAQGRTTRRRHHQGAGFAAALQLRWSRGAAPGITARSLLPRLRSHDPRWRDGASAAASSHS